MENRTIILILIAIVLFLASTICYLLLSSLLIFYGIIIDALWASVLATIILIAITAYQNRLSIKQVEIARKSEFLSHVKVELTWLYPAFLVLTIINYGKGPAIHIHADITFLPSKAEKHWKNGTLAQNESMDIFLPDGRKEIVEKTIERITIKGNYQDLFGQSFLIAEEIDVPKFIDETSELNPVYNQNKVAQAITALNDNLRREVDRGTQATKSLKDEIIKIRETLDAMYRRNDTEALRKEIETMNVILDRIAWEEQFRNQTSSKS